MLKPEQIRSHRFISAGRGTYEASDVDAFLREVSASYEQVFRENGDLVNKISLLAERVSQYKKDEDNIRRALITAERMADKIQRDSQQSAQEQLDSAEKKAQELVASAQNSALRRSYTLGGVALGFRCVCKGFSAYRGIQAQRHRAYNFCGAHRFCYDKQCGGKG